MTFHIANLATLLAEINFASSPPFEAKEEKKLATPSFRFFGARQCIFAAFVL